MCETASITKGRPSTHEHIQETFLDLKEQPGKWKILIDDLRKENERLTAELKENVRKRNDGQLERLLVEDALAAKEAAIQMWKVALDQLGTLEEQLLGKKSLVATERNEMNTRALQDKQDNIAGVNLLSKELGHSRDELSRLKNELGTSHSDLQKCKADLSSARTGLELGKKTISEQSREVIRLKEKVSSMESSLSESDRAIDICKEKISSLTVENAELSATIFNLGEENKKLKSKILACEKNAKESLRTAELAVLEKQEVISKEEFYKNEIKMLQNTIDLEKEKVGLTFKAEIKDIQKHSSETIQQLMSEIENLHKEIGEKQTLFERANREKQALESKVEMLFLENSNGMPVSSFTFEDMCKRLTMAEKTRDELELKVLSLETTLKEVKSSTEQEIDYLSERYSTLKDSYRNLSGDFRNVTADRLKLFDEVTQLKKKTSNLERELSELRKKYANSTAALEADLLSREQHLQQQLQSTEEHYKNVCTELQKLFEAEVRVSNKWRHEAEEVASKSTETFKGLMWEKMNMKSIIYNLINILHQNNVPVPNEILIDLGNDEFHLEPN